MAALTITGRCSSCGRRNPARTAWQESILANFQNGTAKGQNPHGALVFDSDGGVLGTALIGGKYNDGTIFHVTPPATGTGWKFAVLQQLGATSTDSMQPYAGVVRDPSTGVYYGTSSTGGTYSKGTVFSLKSVKGGGWQKTILYSFRGGNDGSTPLGKVIIGLGRLTLWHGRARRRIQ